MSIVTRFAPSPSGFLHIGGARTALFNWLYARAKGGKFYLRIEDTDKARSTKVAIDAIIDGLDWLGLTPDAPPILQSERASQHKAYIDELIKVGAAFRCYMRSDELAGRKTKAIALRRQLQNDPKLSNEEKQAMLHEANALQRAFRSPWRDGGNPKSADLPYTIRLRAPDAGYITLKDRVQGKIKIAADEIDDLILQRANGDPTYMAAVVFDDHDMGITQIIRGDDHLTNTFRQLPIYQALGWDIPSYAHVPLIHGPDGQKLSKRHGAVAIQSYRADGYLAEAINNYLLRLGWSHGDAEIISREQAIAWFNLEGLGKSPARIDFAKLDSVNSHYLQQADNDFLVTEVITRARKSANWDERYLKSVENAISTLRLRSVTLEEIVQNCDFLMQDRPIALDTGQISRLKSKAIQGLPAFIIKLDAIDIWNHESIKIAIQEFCESEDLKIGHIGPAIRLALTAGKPAPDLNLILYWLGKTESIGRVTDLINQTQG